MILINSQFFIIYIFVGEDKNMNAALNNINFENKVKTTPANKIVIKEIKTLLFAPQFQKLRNLIN